MAKFSGDTIIGAIGGALLGASIATVGGIKAGQWEVQRNPAFTVPAEDLAKMVAVIKKHTGEGEVLRFYCSTTSEDTETEEYPCSAAVTSTITSLEDLPDGDAVIKTKGGRP